MEEVCKELDKFKAEKEEVREELDKLKAENEKLRADCSSQLRSKDAIEKLEMEFESCLSSAVQLRLQNEEISVMLLVLTTAFSEAHRVDNLQAQIGTRDKEVDNNACFLMQQLELKDAALAKAKRDLAAECEAMELLSKRVESLQLVEEQNLVIQKELDRCKEMLNESCTHQVRLKQQVTQLESCLQQTIKDDLDRAHLELAEEREKVTSLLLRIESVDAAEKQWQQMEKELEQYKEMLGGLTKSHSDLENQSKKKLGEASDAIQAAVSELAEERERAAALPKKVESLENNEKQWFLTQKEWAEVLSADAAYEDAGSDDIKEDTEGSTESIKEEIAELIDTVKPDMLGPVFQSLFENAKTIGFGGYARVFTATSIVDRLDYAIKFIPFQRGAEFAVLREANAIACLRHANIARYHKHWIEHVTGHEDRLSALHIQTNLYARSLGDRLQDPMTWEEGIKFFPQILNAVHHIHQSGYIHNDINANNILLDINEIVKVSDFGLVRDCEEVVLKSSEQGQVLYTSPERRHDHIGSRAGDIFSLGIVFFECTYFFNSGSERAEKLQALRDFGAIPDDFGAEIGSVEQYSNAIRKMVSHIPDQRPTAAELFRQFKC